MSGSTAGSAGTMHRLCGFLLCMIVSVCVHAQATDSNLVDPDVDTGLLGQPQLVEADVGKGIELSSIELFYRFDGGRYTAIPMRETQQGGIHAAEVPTRDVQAEAMEYYIIAIDTAGEQLAKGSADMPLIRQLISPTDRLDNEEPTEAPIYQSSAEIEPVQEGTRARRNVIYYILGALAVGAVVVAANASDDDDRETDQPCSSSGCDITLVLPVP